MQLESTEISDLTFAEKAVAYDLAGALLLDIGKQAQCCIDVCEIVLRLLDLSFIGRDPTMDQSPHA